jgi:endonuclease/exonuclease/phosphatase family metal-dependent hydrolase
LRGVVKRQRAQKLSKLNSIILWLNYVAIIGLLASVASKYISPENFWFLAFFGLAFPIILILNFCFVIFWIAQFRIQAIFSIIAILLSAKTCLGFIQIDYRNSVIEKKDIKIMSYNSMLFDLYNWSKNTNSRKIILTNIAEENPEILCLQEFYTSEEKGDFNNIEAVKTIITAKNYHVAYTTTMREKDHWGIATFTKYPIVKKGKFEFNTHSNNSCIYTDVLINQDTVRIYNMHLQSISFSKANYKFMNEVKDDTTDVKNEMEKSKNILRRMKRAFVKRAIQADGIALHIANCRYKVIVCGDFNDTPASYVYHTIRGNLKDAFVESGSGFEQSYAGIFPKFRIDYIFHSKEFKSKQYHHLSETVTDHYPIISYIRE